MPFLGAKPCSFVYNELLLKEKTENKPLYSVKMVFEDHWQDFKEKYKDSLREIFDECFILPIGWIIKNDTLNEVENEIE